jgi:molecular chaperone GrpE
MHDQNNAVSKDGLHSTPPIQEPEKITITKEEYEKIKKDAAEYLDEWKRAKADYINFKRETEQRQAEFAQFAAMSMLVEFIPLYDHLQKAVAHVSPEKANDPWVDGIRKIRQEFERCLKGTGVEAMKTEGQIFDPLRHEAMGSEKREGAKPDSIVREVKAGYTLHGKVLIPAQVMVASEGE